jgi:aspartate aminotransferase/aminotransferase
MSQSWIAERTKAFQSSGIRRVFDLAAKLKDPINLSIGQPHFEVPRPVRQACIDAIESNKNGYALTQGMPVLREKLQAEIDAKYGHQDRKVLVCWVYICCLVLSMVCMVYAV